MERLPVVSTHAARRKNGRARAVVLGERVRRRRMALGWTLDVAAEQIGIDPKYLQRIETTAVNLTVSTATRIAEGLGVDLASLVTSSPQNGESPDGAGPVQRPLPFPCFPDPSAALKVVAVNVVALRLKRGWSQRQLGRRADVSVTTIKQIEAGELNITLRSLVLLATSLDVSPATLFAPTDVQPRGKKPRARHRA